MTADDYEPEDVIKIAETVRPVCQIVHQMFEPVIKFSGRVCVSLLVVPIIHNESLGKTKNIFYRFKMLPSIPTSLIRSIDEDIPINSIEKKIVFNWYDGKSTRVVLRAQAFRYISKRCSQLCAFCFLFCLWLGVLIDAWLMRMLGFVAGCFWSLSWETYTFAKHNTSVTGFSSRGCKNHICGFT